VNDLVIFDEIVKNKIEAIVSRNVAMKKGLTLKEEEK
jgi:hypothetical protein